MDAVRYSSTQLRGSQQVSRPIVNSRSEYFLNNFNRLYELQGQDNQAYLGVVEVYHMNQHAHQRQKQAKQEQLNITRTVNGQVVTDCYRKCGLQRPLHLNHDIRNEYGQVIDNQVYHEYLRPYALGDELPKWLPFRVAKKTINVSQYQADTIRSYIDSNMGGASMWRAPELAKVFAYQQNGSQMTVFFEYQNILQDEISQRIKEKNPFSEELLWKLLFSLTSAASKQSLTDIRPSRVFYEHYQGSVMPHDLTQSRDVPLGSKLQGGESIFYSEEWLSEFNQSQNGMRQSQTLRTNQANESFQIGLTVLCAGLLLNERELGIWNNRQFNRNRLQQLLEEFGQIYGRQDRLLQFILQEFFIFNTRQTPAQVWNLFSQHHIYASFLDPQFKAYLAAQIKQSPATQNSLFMFETSHPNTINFSQEFMQRYGDVFFYQINGKNATRPVITQQAPSSSQILRSSQQVRYSSRQI